MTMTGDVVGTPNYMSPEQIVGARDTVDGRTDVYSLGATLYEVLALKPPFEAATLPGLVRRIAKEEPRSLRYHDRKVPRDLDTIVLEALEKDPRGALRARPASDPGGLRAFAQGHTIQTRRATVVEKLWRAGAPPQAPCGAAHHDRRSCHRHGGGLGSAHAARDPSSGRRGVRSADRAGAAAWRRDSPERPRTRPRALLADAVVAPSSRGARPVLPPRARTAPRPRRCPRRISRRPSGAASRSHRGARPRRRPGNASRIPEARAELERAAALPGGGPVDDWLEAVALGRQGRVRSAAPSPTRPSPGEALPRSPGPPVAPCSGAGRQGRARRLHDGQLGGPVGPPASRAGLREPPCSRGVALAPLWVATHRHAAPSTSCGSPCVSGPTSIRGSSSCRRRRRTGAWRSPPKPSRPSRRPRRFWIAHALALIDADRYWEAFEAAERASNSMPEVPGPGWSAPTGTSTAVASGKPTGMSLRGSEARSRREADPAVPRATLRAREPSARCSGHDSQGARGGPLRRGGGGLFRSEEMEALREAKRHEEALAAVDGAITLQPANARTRLERPSCSPGCRERTRRWRCSTTCAPGRGSRQAWSHASRPSSRTWAATPTPRGSWTTWVPRLRWSPRRGSCAA